MKKHTMIGVMAGLVAFSGVASAEMLSGTITSIDPGAQKITLLRNDTRESVTVKVKDQDALASLQAGNNVSLDANQRLFGGWKAETIAAMSNAVEQAKSESVAARNDLSSQQSDQIRKENSGANPNPPSNSASEAPSNSSTSPSNSGYAGNP